MKKIIFLLLLFMSFLNSYACLNGDSKILKSGEYLYYDIHNDYPTGHNINTEHLEDFLKNLDSLFLITKDLDYLSDKGLVWILQEKYHEAIELYHEIEKLDPHRYSTASNLGTAYELIGNNEQALFWIKKAVNIDPSSHFNSEWIHVKILEAKLKGESAFNTQFLLNTDFGTSIYPKRNLSLKVLNYLYKELNYQLNERMTFIKSEDPLVAQLLFDLGNIAFIQKKYNYAANIYDSAQNYGYSNDLLKIRKNEVERLLKKQNRRIKFRNSLINISSFIIHPLGIVLIVLFIIFIIRYFIRKKKKS